MRAGIGLIGLLVGVALLVWLFSIYAIPTAQVGKRAQHDARQISGRGDDGVAAADSFATRAEFNGSKLTGLVVTDVTPGGAMQTYYGLANDDRITAINGMRLDAVASGSEELAQALVAEAFGKHQPLTVMRAGQTVTLPAPPGSLPAPASQPAASAPPPPAPPEGTSIGDQLQRIQDAAGSAGVEEE